MSLHWCKAVLIGLLESGRANEWVVTEKLGDLLKSNPSARIAKRFQSNFWERFHILELILGYFCGALGDYLGVKVHACVGETSVREDQWILSSGVHVGVGTPGRVFDMLRRQSLRLDYIKMFVLDEADEMLSHGFKDQDNGLVPIVEPEILLDGEHGIDRAFEVSQNVWPEVFFYMAENNVMYEVILLKPSMVTP